MAEHLKASHNIILDQNLKSLEKRTSGVLETSETHDKGTWARRTVLWLCEDMLPFNLVNGSGFQKWMIRNKYVSNVAEIPSNVAISQSALNDCYSIVKDAVKKLLSSAPSVIVIVTDMWTSLGKNPYITLSVRFMDCALNLINLVVTTEQLEHPHTGETIARTIQDILMSYGLQDRQVIAVGDNGRNIVRIGPHITGNRNKEGCMLQCKQYCRCLGHNIHLCFTQDMPKQKQFDPALKVIAKMKRIHGVLAYKSIELKAEYQRQQLNELVQCLTEADEITQDLLDDETNDETNGEYGDEMSKTPREVYTQCVSSLEKFSRFEQFNVTRWKSAENVTVSFVKNFGKCF